MFWMFESAAKAASQSLAVLSIVAFKARRKGLAALQRQKLVIARARRVHQDLQTLEVVPITRFSENS